MSGNPVTRGRVLTDALAQLADTLVDDYDVLDLLHTVTSEYARLLPIAAAGLLLADQRGQLWVASSSTEQAFLVELFQVQTQQGPCMECARTGQQVAIADLGVDDARWPTFSARAREHGFRAVHALPLRLGGRVIGALNLFRTAPGLLSAADIRVAQALADIAAVALVQKRALAHHEVVAEQLEDTLNRRMITEQAKGFLAGTGDISLQDAFARLRAYARRHDIHLSELARQLVNGTIDPVAVLRDTSPDRPDDAMS